MSLNLLDVCNFKILFRLEPLNVFRKSFNVGHTWRTLQNKIQIRVVWCAHLASFKSELMMILRELSLQLDDLQFWVLKSVNVFESQLSTCQQPWLPLNQFQSLFIQFPKLFSYHRRSEFIQSAFYRVYKMRNLLLRHFLIDFIKRSWNRMLFVM